MVAKITTSTYSADFFTSKAEISSLIDEYGVEDFHGALDYEKKITSAALLMGGMIFLFEKPSIKTMFCFGEHGYDFDKVNEKCRAASESETFFKNENLGRLNSTIELINEVLSGKGIHRPVFIKYEDGFSTLNFINGSNCHRYCIDFDRLYNDSVGEWEYNGRLYRFTTNAELEIFRAALIEERKRFEKRLDTYLKRYGLTKCHFWVYWADE